MNFSVYIEYIIFILYNEHIYTKIHRISFPFLVSPRFKVPEMRYNKGIEGNRTIIIKSGMERENGGFVTFGEFWFLHFRPLFSLFRVCCAGDRFGDVRGCLAWKTGRKRETGENWRGRGSRSRARFWPLLRFRLAGGLTACDLCSYNAREIDIREDRGKSGLYCFRKLFLILVYSRLRLVLRIIVFPLVLIRWPLRFFVRLFRSFRFRRQNQVSSDLKARSQINRARTLFFLAFLLCLLASLPLLCRSFPGCIYKYNHYILSACFQPLFIDSRIL